jgi:hypothetical protein
LSENPDLDVLGWIKSLGERPDTEAKPIRIDDDGFHHFEAAARRTKPGNSRLMGNVVADLQQAARVDAGLVQ